MKEYTKYFPHNNASKICEEIAKERFFPKLSVKIRAQSNDFTRISKDLKYSGNLYKSLLHKSGLA